MGCRYMLAFAVASIVVRSMPLTVRLSFSADVDQTWVEHRSHAAPPKHTMFRMAVSRSKLALRQSSLLTDGRLSDDLQLFGQVQQYHFQPFFDELVCYKFDLPLTENNDSDSSWRAATYHAMGIYEDLLAQVKIEGNATVDGTPCITWAYTAGNPNISTVINYKLYVDKHGALRAVNLTQSYTGYLSVTTTFFRNYSSEPPHSTFSPGAHCVDLTQGQVASDQSLVNDAGRITLTNTEAQLHWHAAPSLAFEGLTLAVARRRLGADVQPLRLPLKEGTQLQDSFDSGTPVSFDVRKHWRHCRSMKTIRNQGDCGSCYAFAAIEVFADRLCIRGGSSHFTGSVEYLVECDTRNNGCGGGLLDDAWMFLRDTGVPAEACQPYTHCPHPELKDCGRKNDAAVFARSSCPTACRDGSHVHRLKAESAYAVAKPGNVRVMQLEILRHGPIESSYFVFSDFLTYSNGTYFRTPSATGPLGGHAVKILGWGVDSNNVEYWLVANSWSKAWGEHGFFRIRRGTNECGIETTPVAGHVSRQHPLDAETNLVV
mmetsp:Transcript_118826/g.236732  ORF Transcript_118826/g.236732 Transcript_118826/m.236732 type:complete len:543 (+) Transcript_118826:60-1688(+)